jgi:hypothetical protein
MTIKKYLRYIIDWRAPSFTFIVLFLLCVLFFPNKLPFHQLAFSFLLLYLSSVLLLSIVKNMDLILLFKKENGSIGKSLWLLVIPYLPTLLICLIFSFGILTELGKFGYIILMVVFVIIGFVNIVIGSRILHKWGLLDVLHEKPSS